MENATEAGPKEKKNRHRSPNYPTVGLKEAVERVRKFYDVDGKAGAPSKVAAVHIGFASPHGQALSVLAALKKFGLIAPSGERLVPTQRAIEITMLPVTDSRRAKALKDAALDPPIYAELIEQHRGTGFPSDEVLESELVTYHGFNRNSVAGFVKDFRETLDFAGLSDLSQLELEPENEETQNMTETQGQMPNPLATPLLGGPSTPKQISGIMVNAWTLSPHASAELRINGTVNAEELELLRDYVEITIKALSRKAENQGT